LYRAHERRRVARLVVAAFAALAAGGCGEQARTSDDADTDGETMPTRPAFTDPADGITELAVTARGALILRVSAVVSNLTVLLLDGEIVTALSEVDQGPHLVGEPELALHWPVGGAMVVGDHTLQLRTPSPVAPEPLVSAEVQLRLVATEPPEFSVESVEPTDIEATSLLAQATANHSWLLADTPGRAAVRIVPFSGANWSFGEGFEVAAGGLTVNADRRLAVSLGCVDDFAMSCDRLRFAWRRDDAVARIEVIEIDRASRAVTPIASVSLGDLDLGPVEHAALGNPRLVGDAMLFEVFHTRDVEHPKPGERSIWSIYFIGPTPTVPGREPLGAGIDFDRLGPALDSRGDRHPSRVPVAVRTDGRGLSVFDVDASSGIARAVARFEGLGGPEVVGSFRVFLGAFRSVVWAATTKESLVVAGQDADDTAVQPYASFALEPGADLAMTLADGAPVYFVASSGQPLRAVAVTSGTPREQVLAGAQCDAIAAPARCDGVVALACLQDSRVVEVQLRTGP
jgi:hypothetical protein